jgi:hypothetical protein
MKNKLIKKIYEIRKKRQKENQNYRWKLRYHNLEKKYEELNNKVKILEKEIDNDLNKMTIKNKNKTIKHQKEIISNLRLELKEIRRN